VVDHRKRYKKRENRNYAQLDQVVIDLIWGYLTPTQQAIYPAVLRFADCYTRYTHPYKCSQSLIGRVARRGRPICQPQVARAMAGLESDWGLVVKKWTAKGLSYYLPREIEVVTFLFQRAKREGLPHDLFWRLCLYYWKVEVPDEDGTCPETALPQETVPARVEDSEPDWDSMPSTLDDIRAALGEAGVKAYSSRAS
jgi:hypothetical protein